jgi:hypothetical protein
MGLLASVGADVSSLVLETVEGLVAERTLVGTRHLALALASVGHAGDGLRHERCSRHFCWCGR